MNIFNSVKQTRVKKSMFDLSHDVKLSCNMGELVPVLVMPCIPGDHVQLSGETLVRLAPVLAPLMHRIDCTIHYFFVPNRILWPNWEQYITGNKLRPGSAEVPPSLPQFDLQSSSGQTPEFQRLADFMGIPPTATIGWSPVTVTFPVSALPFAAYGRIWYEYYRDQNQQIPDSVVSDLYLSDGLNVIDLDTMVIQNRAWEHDYFTAALPWQQKGGSVRIPTAQAPNGGTALLLPDGSAPADSGLSVASGGLIENFGLQPLDVTMGTINDLRAAYKLQEWLEKNARGGTRYKES